MNNEIVKVDGYDAALAKLKASLPDVFSFEIDDYYLHGLSMSRAIATSQSLRTLEHEARSLGYGSISHDYHGASNSWRYVFRRTTPRPVAPQPISERSADGVIDI